MLGAFTAETEIHRAAHPALALAAMSAAGGFAGWIVAYLGKSIAGQLAVTISGPARWRPLSCIEILCATLSVRNAPRLCSIDVCQRWPGPPGPDDLRRTSAEAPSGASAIPARSDPHFVLSTRETEDKTPLNSCTVANLAD